VLIRLSAFVVSHTVPCSATRPRSLGRPFPLSSAMQCDQAALTGESLPVKKFSGDVAFAGEQILCA